MKELNYTEQKRYNRIIEESVKINNRVFSRLICNPYKEEETRFLFWEAKAALLYVNNGNYDWKYNLKTIDEIKERLKSVGITDWSSIDEEYQAIRDSAEIKRLRSLAKIESRERRRQILEKAVNLVKTRLGALVSKYNMKYDVDVELKEGSCGTVSDLSQLHFVLVCHMKDDNIEKPTRLYLPHFYSRSLSVPFLSKSITAEISVKEIEESYEGFVQAKQKYVELMNCASNNDMKFNFI